MRRYHIVSGILLILPIIDFAVAAPVLVQEKRQTRVYVEHTPEDAITILGKRGNELDELTKLFPLYEDHFAQESPAARPSSSSPPSGPDHGSTDVGEPLPSIPEDWSPEPPSPESLTGSGYEMMEGDVLHGPSSPASSTMSDAQNPGPSTESDHLGMDAPLPSPMYPTWFHPDNLNNLPGAHAPRPNLGPSNAGPSTVFDSDHRLVVEEPPSRPASPTEFDADHEYQVVHPPLPSPGTASPTESDHEMVDVPPSSPVSFKS
jgi:hypothetical protein